MPIAVKTNRGQSLVFSSSFFAYYYTIFQSDRALPDIRKQASVEIIHETPWESGPL